MAGRNFILGGSYEQPHDRFQRAQSLHTSLLPWEDRVRPLRPWAYDVATLACGLILVGVILFFLPDARDGLMAWRGK